MSPVLYLTKAKPATNSPYLVCFADRFLAGNYISAQSLLFLAAKQTGHMNLSSSASTYASFLIFGCFIMRPSVNTYSSSLRFAKSSSGLFFETMRSAHLPSSTEPDPDPVFNQDSHVLFYLHVFRSVQKSCITNGIIHTIRFSLLFHTASSCPPRTRHPAA